MEIRYRNKEKEQIPIKEEVQPQNIFKLQDPIMQADSSPENKINIKDESPAENTSPVDEISPMNIGSPLEDISPIEKDLSISNKDASKRNISYNANDEKEVPLDFNDIKPKENSIPQEQLSDERIEQIVLEEAELYMPSYYICNEIYDFDRYIDEYKAYQIIPLSKDKTDYLFIG